MAHTKERLKNLINRNDFFKNNKDQNSSLKNIKYKDESKVLQYFW